MHATSFGIIKKNSLKNKKFSFSSQLGNERKQCQFVGTSHGKDNSKLFLTSKGCLWINILHSEKPKNIMILSIYKCKIWVS